MSVLRSIKDSLPKLIKRMSSIVKDAVVIDVAGKEKSLKDSKDIAKERKNVKETLYNIVDINFSNLTKDVHTVKSENTQIVINPDEFESIMNRFYTEIRPFCECFITEKKMSPTISKFVTIVFAGLLIEHIYRYKNK